MITFWTFIFIVMFYFYINRPSFQYKSTNQHRKGNDV